MTVEASMYPNLLSNITLNDQVLSHLIEDSRTSIYSSESKVHYMSGVWHMRRDIFGPT